MIFNLLIISMNNYTSGGGGWWLSGIGDGILDLVTFGDEGAELRHESKEGGSTSSSASLSLQLDSISMISVDSVTPNLCEIVLKLTQMSPRPLNKHNLKR